VLRCPMVKPEPKIGGVGRIIADGPKVGSMAPRRGDSRAGDAGKRWRHGELLLVQLHLEVLEILDRVPNRMLSLYSCDRGAEPAEKIVTWL